jgi:hypothetical protein
MRTATWMAAVVMLGAACRERPMERQVEGTAAEVTAERIVVTPDAGEPMVLEVVPGIPVTIDGRVAAAELIPEGARVWASYTVQGGEVRALRIAAETAEGGPVTGGVGEVPGPPYR